MERTTSRSKIVCCRDLGPTAMALLTEHGNLEVVVWTEDRRCDRGWILENIPGATGLVVSTTEIVNRELVDTAGPNLRVVSTTSIGYEHIDLEVIAARKIQVGYTPDIPTEAVADSAIMLALMATRAAGQSYSLVKNNGWPTLSRSPFALCGPQLSTTPFSPTRTIGFLGFGRIAHAVLTRLAAFGITHCIYTPRPGAAVQTARDAQLKDKHNLQEIASVDLSTLAGRSDVLFILTPGGSATHHLVNSAFLRQMKPTSVLVNNGRGSVVDSIALAQALSEGWIWGAGLDVVEEEGAPGGVTSAHPLVSEPRCVVLPHLGSVALETREEMAWLTARNVLAGVLGEELPVALDYSAIV
ncbi:hypothetical protein FB45DRAFT_895240 [Roridomyces roridus]|uniref:Glyoxylate reductase n=1 Tax=Roridomyces roridus TaxID=1738132 RepID=A0AAD7CGY3_9AGAR|nr:hypothetical protein FB45DRAFT_895240 [Roridomyces roridus]